MFYISIGQVARTLVVKGYILLEEELYFKLINTFVYKYKPEAK